MGLSLALPQKIPAVQCLAETTGFAALPNVKYAMRATNSSVQVVCVSVPGNSPALPAPTCSASYFTENLKIVVEW